MDKLYALLLGGMVQEMKVHPWTSLTALAALIMVVWTNQNHAKAADVSALQDQLRDIRAAQIEDKLLNARFRYCHAQEDDQRLYFRDLVSEYAEQYRKVTLRAYVLPSCSEV